MEETIKQYKKLIIVILVAVSLLVLLVLVQRQQDLRSKAGGDINSTLSVTDENGVELEYIGNDTFRTTSKRIKLENKDL